MKIQHFAAAALAAISTVAAQQTYYAVSSTTPNKVSTLTRFEVSAGAVALSDTFDLNANTPGGVAVVNDVDFVGAELWVCTSEGLLRYDAQPVTFVGRGLASDNIQAIVPTPSGAVLFALQEVILVDAQGNETARWPVDVTTDAIAFQGGYLAVQSQRIYRLDARFRRISEFGTDAFGIADSTSIGYFPDGLRELRDGRIAVLAVLSVAIIDPSGTTQNVFNPGQFEWEAIETGSRLLFVPAANFTTLVHPETGERFGVDGTLDDLSSASVTAAPLPTSTASGRRCPPSPNSVGAGAFMDLLASDDLMDGSLSLVVTGLPAASTGLTIWGAPSPSTTLGDGSLCISTAPPGLIRGPLTTSSSDGTTVVRLDFQSPGTGAAFLPGSSWTFQMVYRDVAAGGAQFNTTDAVFMTFAP